MAKKQNRIAELRKEVDQLRKSYTGAMSSANKAVYKGIERLAEHELAAIKKHYEEALKNLKKLRKGGDPRDIATAQLKLLQDTIDRIMQNARESMSILDDTRKQISTDIRKELQKAEKKTGSATGAAKTAKASSAKSAAKSGTASARKKTAARKTTAKSGTSASRAKKSTAAGGSARKASTAKSKSASTRRKSTAAKTATGASGGTSGGSGGTTT